MIREAISEARTKRTPQPHKLPLHKWQAQTHRPTLNRKRILRAKCGGEVVRQLPVPFLPHRLLHAIFSNGSLECIAARRPRLLRLLRLRAGAHQADEHPTRTIAARHFVSFVSDRTTSFLL